MRVIGLEGDHVDPDVLVQLEGGWIRDETGERVLPEDVRRALRSEILSGPPLVLVVAVDAVHQERQPADAALGERYFEARELPERMAPQKILDGENRDLG